MASSRAVMMSTGTTQKAWMRTRANMAPSTRNLSASGSRNAPDTVTPWRRARKPSMPSLSDSANQSASTDADAPPSTIHAMSNGVRSTRTNVTPLAGVSRADGPKPTASGRVAILRDLGSNGGAYRLDIGPERGDDVHVDERPGRKVVGHAYDAVDLGCFPVRAADARRVDEHLDAAADEGVALRRGDGVLHLRELGEPFVHQLGRHLAVERD